MVLPLEVPNSYLVRVQLAFSPPILLMSKGRQPWMDRPSLEERITRLKELIGIDEQTTIILLEDASAQRRPATLRKSRLN